MRDKLTSPIADRAGNINNRTRFLLELSWHCRLALWSPQRLAGNK